MRFELFVAARYLRAKRRQAVIGVITWISIAGVAVGVASLILALAITNGTRRDLQDRLLSSTSHVDLMRTMSDGIRHWRPLLDRLRRLPHVVAAAPGLYEPVLISRNGARAGGAMLKGIIPAQERAVSDMLADLKAGSVAPLSEAANSEDQYGSPTPPIVVGTDLADSIGASLNDETPVLRCPPIFRSAAARFRSNTIILPHRGTKIHQQNLMGTRAGVDPHCLINLAGSGWVVRSCYATDGY